MPSQGGYADTASKNSRLKGARSRSGDQGRHRGSSRDWGYSGSVAVTNNRRFRGGRGDGKANVLGPMIQPLAAGRLDLGPKVRAAARTSLDWGSSLSLDRTAARNMTIKFAHHEPLPRVSFSSPLLLVVV
jgi:hypothetical protein